MSQTDRWVDRIGPMPRIESPGPLGEVVQQDGSRPGFDRANALLMLASARPDAVLIGDSLTAGWQVAPLLADLWPVVINRGVGGDSAKWLKHRIAADVVQLRPRYCVLMIGTNDIAHRFGYDSDAKIVRDYKAHLADSLGQLADAGIETFVGTIPPVRCTLIDDEMNPRKHQCIPRMNAEAVKLARKHKMHLVDYYPHFLDDDGVSLRKDLSTDACHLNARGQYLMYLVLRRAIEG